METLEQIKVLVETLTVDATKFYNGNKSAGVRARKLSQELKAAAQKLRADILNHSKEQKDV